MNNLRFGSPAKPHPGRAHAYPTLILEGAIERGPCRCGKAYPAEAVVRGKRSARMGKDQERAFEKEHGPRKIGELGDPVDHIGAFGKYQVKSTRAPVTAMLRNLDRMDAIYTDKVPILIQRFVRAGVRTETFVTVRLADWAALHGRDELHGEGQ